MTIPNVPALDGRQFARPTAVREIVGAYAVLGLLLLWIGYAVQGFATGLLPEGFLPGSGSLDAARVDPTLAEGVRILLNNLLFFALVSVFPIINIVLFAPQFLMLGGNVHTISGMSFADQTTILFRHTIWEIAALLVSVAVSYLFLFALREYLSDSGADRGLLVRRIRTAAWGYPIIVALALVGAILEGSAVVHV